MAACGHWLNFWGSVIGAASGIIAAFLAVYLQKRSENRSGEITLRALIEALRGAAARLAQDASHRPVEAVREVVRAFSAVKDTAAGIRTLNAAIATIASRLEHTSVWTEIARLRDANGGINVSHAKGVSQDIISLCDELDAYFK